MPSLQFNWDKQYETGISIIDTQHKQLIDIYNKLTKAYIAESTSELLQGVLNELNNYAQFHFKTEEEIFKQANTIDFEKHLLEHKSYKNSIKQFENTVSQGVRIDFSLLSFLKKWWGNHILVKDKEYIAKMNLAL